MMNRQQFLLTKLAEEGTEIAQIALKTSQFGMEEGMPGQPYTNKERVHQELDDLMGIIQMLNDEYGFGYIPSKEAIENKINKVNKFYMYSVGLGMVEDMNVK